MGDAWKSRADSFSSFLGDLLKIRARVYISGEVQGVFFRDTTAHEASLRRVRGWARNLRDGRVEALFEGEKEDVQDMIDFCRRGPRLAKVENVDVEWEPYTGSEEHFEVR